MVRASIFATALVLANVFLAQTALAAGEADFVKAFAGTWVTYDSTLSTAGACNVTLSETRAGSVYGAQQQNCGGAFAGVRTWGIVDQQLALMDASGNPLVRLGGNQNRVTGQLVDGTAVVLDRKEHAESVHRFWNSLNCVYYGYTARCADPAEAAPPALPGADAKVLVLVKLNARAEARPDAPVVTVLEPKACVAVKQCTTASEGLWCQISAGGKEAWISKHAVRLAQYPILTFVNGCSP